MKVQGQTIARVNKTNVQSTNNIAITMSNGDTHWVNARYCASILSSLFLDGAAPTALVGSTVSYEKRVHAAGDAVTNEDGSVVAGKTFSKDGYRILSFRVEDLGAKGQKMEEVAFTVAKQHSLAGAFSAVASVNNKPAVGQREIADKVKQQEQPVAADEEAI